MDNSQTPIETAIIDISAPWVVDLSGLWHFRPDPKGLGEHYPEQLHYSHADDARWMEPEHPIDRWSTLRAPGSWTAQGHAGLKIGWYRRSFSLPPRQASSRYRLDFEGVDYNADVWLNGRYLGSHEGYLGRFGFDIGEWLDEGENMLVVRVEAPDDVLGEESEFGQLKTLFKGALGRWDMNDPESKPAGIWGKVTVRHTGSARIEAVRIAGEPLDLPPRGQPDARVPVQGVVEVALTHTGEAAPPTRLRWSLAAAGGGAVVASGETALAPIAGERRVSLDFRIEAAGLWWTWDLGPQNLYELSVVLEQEDGVSDEARLTTGFRKLEFGEGWDLRLNGVSFFQRGANYLSDLDLSSMTAARYERDAELFRQANLNTVHPFCLMERDEFYRVCDRSGLLVYQDFPIWTTGGITSDFARASVRQFDEMLDRLQANPSVAIWNFGSQPSVANFEKHCSALVERARARDPQRIAHYGNAAISYDPADRVHPVESFFWSESQATRLEAKYGWRRDCHMYPGWYFGAIEDIDKAPESHFGFVSEFGGQALPGADDLAAFLDLSTDTINWPALARRCAQPVLMRRNFRDIESLRELIERSQDHQARLLKHHIEFIRSKKGDPCHGLHVFAFNDCWPAVTWSIVGYSRTPKKAYFEVRQSMAPVQAFWNGWTRERAAGQPVLLDFSLVNDGAEPLHDGRLEIIIEAPDGSQFSTVATIDTFGTQAAAKYQLECLLPEVGGECVLTTRLNFAGGETVTNRYVFGVT
ncbi:beta-mannosidase [Kaistia sp. 32K]|uniref:glycoside hydrolase family 2 protein n=1 Tax=Kaistia sp. 32K TaxID=2795690 RepID=UPI001915AE0E|nr:sugar-binding domain-containing protein [Kaistia sp. 32K]BCP56346.1 beta-mannosidase [Kaistia sp. 32K]